MQKLGLNQSLSQKLSPQQIQFIKLLQIPTSELNSRIEEELEINPALEEGREEASDDSMQDDNEFDNQHDDYGDEGNDYDDINVEDYIRDDDIAGYKMQGDGGGQEEERESPIVMGSTLTDSLTTQLSYLNLDEKQHAIGMQLIGSIDNDGYIRRELESISNDLAFSQNIDVSEEEIERVLFMIQQFDPAGIAARNLQECLVLQLERRTDQYDVAGLALRVIEECFDEFTKKHYDKIQRKLDVDDPEELRDAINMIIKLNPKPGDVAGTDVKMQYVIPDFILINNSGKLELSLNSRNAPELKVSRSYAEMLETYDKSDKKNKQIRETATFVKQKLDAARWFIDAIKQRQQTLLRTMNAIIQYQYDFFLTGDESRLRPMILKDIASEIDMDISTVSRVANSKYVQTEFGIYPLKYFFSEGIATDTGEDVSSREVKAILKEFIDNENKSKPLSDDKLEKMLNQKGYTIARRTVAKYREQLDIPVARLRKQF